MVSRTLGNASPSPLIVLGAVVMSIGPKTVLLKEIERNKQSISYDLGAQFLDGKNNKWIKCQWHNRSLIILNPISRQSNDYNSEANASECSDAG